MKEFTIDELKKFDGKNGRPAYVAYNGKLYDVTQSGAWDAGGHFGQHFAGKDLTMELKDAPHGDQVFEHIPMVGELKPTEGLRVETKSPASTQRVTTSQPAIEPSFMQSNFYLLDKEGKVFISIDNLDKLKLAQIHLTNAEKRFQTKTKLEEDSRSIAKTENQ